MATVEINSNTEVRHLPLNGWGKNIVTKQPASSKTESVVASSDSTMSSRQLASNDVALYINECHDASQRMAQARIQLSLHEISFLYDRYCTDYDGDLLEELCETPRAYMNADETEIANLTPEDEKGIRKLEKEIDRIKFDNALSLSTTVTCVRAIQQEAREKYNVTIEC